MSSLFKLLAVRFHAGSLTARGSQGVDQLARTLPHPLTACLATTHHPTLHECEAGAPPHNMLFVRTCALPILLPAQLT
jgi:hypothetical protein